MRIVTGETCHIALEETLGLTQPVCRVSHLKCVVPGTLNTVEVELVVPQRLAGAIREYSTVIRANLIRHVAAAGLEILAEVSLVEDVIAAGDKVDPASKNLLGGLRGQAKTARGIFAIGNAGVDAVLLSKQRNASLQHLATGGTYDVPDDQEVEGAIYRRAEAFAFFWDFRK